MTVTLGELFRTAEVHLEAAETARGSPEPAIVAYDLARTVSIMARYLENQPAHGTTRWAKAHRTLARNLRRAATELQGHATQADDSGSGHFASATKALSAGLDLLATHDAATGPTYWGTLIPSAPVQAELVGRLATVAARLAPWADWLTHTASSRTDDAGAAQVAYATAARHLRLASAVGDRLRPVHRALLHQVPAARPPARVPPADSEPVEELCRQIAAGADQLRFASLRAPDRAIWSPAMNARGWEYAARAAAIITQLSGLILQDIANTASLTGARDEWLKLRTVWTGFSTDTSVVASPASTVLGDLVLRTGRLAFDNPSWTPSAAPPPPRRAIADVRMVVAALHQAADALAVTAAADRASVWAAFRANRLYVPTRTVDDRANIPRRFAPAPEERVDLLIAAYQPVIAASRQAASVLGDLAVKTKAQSRPLALARKLSPAALAAQDRPGKYRTNPIEPTACPIQDVTIRSRSRTRR